jgi:hypothetical protein
MIELSYVLTQGLSYELSYGLGQLGENRVRDGTKYRIVSSLAQWGISLSATLYPTFPALAERIDCLEISSVSGRSSKLHSAAQSR